jgi:hypothetical protein
MSRLCSWVEYNVLMAEITLKAWQCDLCGYQWLKVAGRPIPSQCRNSGCRSRRWNSADIRGAGSATPKSDERGGNRAAVPVLRKAKGKPEQLHPVQPVRSELVASGGGGHNERPSPEPHKDHRTYKAGEQRYCQDCGKFY